MRLNCFWAYCALAFYISSVLFWLLTNSWINDAFNFTASVEISTTRWDENWLMGPMWCNSLYRLPGHKLRITVSNLLAFIEFQIASSLSFLRQSRPLIMFRLWNRCMRDMQVRCGVHLWRQGLLTGRSLSLIYCHLMISTLKVTSIV